MNETSEKRISLALSIFGLTPSIAEKIGVDALELVPLWVLKWMLFVAICSGIYAFYLYYRKLINSYPNQASYIRSILKPLAVKILLTTLVSSYITFFILWWNNILIFPPKWSESCNEPIKTASEDLIIFEPCEERTVVKAVLNENGNKSVNTWNGKDGSDTQKDTPLIYRTTYLLTVINNSGKTIKGLHLKQYERSNNTIPVNIPIYGTSETKVDLYPDSAARFEVGYRYSLNTYKPPETFSEDAKNDYFSNVYYFLKNKGDSYGKISTFGTFIFGGRREIVANGTPVEDLFGLRGIMWPLGLQVSAENSRSVFALLTVKEDKDNVFKLQLVSLSKRPLWATQ